MISVVVYGRNDSHGYNLHRRAAISLNCTAELLQEDDSEIIFVDYNSPNDFPTFPEAISDTLTEKAKGKLRILRVRPHVHERFRGRTKSPVIESISRNIGVRRSNPLSRWILSTNTDLIFLPLRKKTLEEVSSGLAPGYYHAPRIEIPEAIWEGFDRSRPQSVIESVKSLAQNLFLNEIVTGPEAFLFDACGDFQLIERRDLFSMHGFNQDMLLGWHVDANIARRLYLKYGVAGDLSADIYAYHCDHTRQVTHLHGRARTVDDWGRFVVDVSQPGLPSQSESWGFPDDLIEEISLRRPTFCVASLDKIIGARQAEPMIVEYSERTYDRSNYDARHIMPFLLDLFVSTEKTADICWAGGRADTLRLFVEAWSTLGFSGRILIDQAMLSEGFIAVPGTTLVEKHELNRLVTAFVFDFGPPKPIDDEPMIPLSLRRALGRGFVAAAQSEHERLALGLSPRRIIMLNTINTFYEGLFEHLNGNYGPFSTRLRHGFFRPLDPGGQHLLDRVRPGSAGAIKDGVLCSTADATGEVCQGSLPHCLPGRYILNVVISGCLPERDPEPAIATIELSRRNKLIAALIVRDHDLAAGSASVSFAFDSRTAAEIDTGTEIKIRKIASIELAIKSLALTGPGESGNDILDGDDEPALRIGNWLPFQSVGEAGTWQGGVLAKTGMEGSMAYGPYWTLPPGAYTAVVEYAEHAERSFGPACRLEAVADGEILTHAFVPGGDAPLTRRTLYFIVPTMRDEHRPVIELRVWPVTRAPFALRGITVSALRDTSPELTRFDPLADDYNWLPDMQVGQAGHPLVGSFPFVASRANVVGVIVYGPYWPLPSGEYTAEFTVEVPRQRWRSPLEKIFRRREPTAPHAVAIFDVAVNSGHVIASVSVNTGTVPPSPLLLDFSIPDQVSNSAEVELRVWVDGQYSLTIKGVRVKRRLPIMSPAG